MQSARWFEGYQPGLQSIYRISEKCPHHKNEQRDMGTERMQLSILAQELEMRPYDCISGEAAINYN